VHALAAVSVNSLPTQNSGSEQHAEMKEKQLQGGSFKPAR
jgi:hypothetical protein